MEGTRLARLSIGDDVAIIVRSILIALWDGRCVTLEDARKYFTIDMS